MKYKYCKEHKQKYDMKLTECPICVGIKMGGSMIQRLRTGQEVVYEDKDNSSSTKEDSG